MSQAWAVMYIGTANNTTLFVDKEGNAQIGIRNIFVKVRMVH